MPVQIVSGPQGMAVRSVYQGGKIKMYENQKIIEMENEKLKRISPDNTFSAEMSLRY